MSYSGSSTNGLSYHEPVSVTRKISFMKLSTAACQSFNKILRRKKKLKNLTVMHVASRIIAINIVTKVKRNRLACLEDISLPTTKKFTQHLSVSLPVPSVAARFKPLTLGMKGRVFCHCATPTGLLCYVLKS